MRLHRWADRLSTIALVLIILLGVGVLLYPAVSNWINLLHQSYAIGQYHTAVDNLTKEDCSAYLAEAQAYNQRLYETPDALYQPELVDGYEEALRTADTDVMCYVTIPKIHTELPVYHGTDDGILNSAVGHLEGTSLPVGDENTHSVLSAHRGLPSAQLFSELDRLEEGDVFIIRVLDQTLTYEVDQIRTVRPDQVDDLKIAEGCDYVTLMTCTPYGINTHRLLVRGHRIANLPEEDTQVNQMARLWLYVGVGVTALLFLGACLVAGIRRKNEKRRTGGHLL